MKENNVKVSTLFGDTINPNYTHRDNPWDHWKGMPVYDPHPEFEYHKIKIEFDTSEDVSMFRDKINQNLTNETKSLWYPDRDVDDYSSIRYVSSFEDSNTPKYPIYIVSKGRFEKRLTSDTLVRMQCKHYIICEESEYESYKSRVDENFVTVIILDPTYQINYDACDNLGLTKSKGPGPARNFAWDHSISMGFKRHWVMDDNIHNFYRLNGSKRVIVSSGAIIRAMEDHSDRYDNVWMSGPNYRFFNPPMSQNPPFFTNTRIYSCNLILNDIPHRWRGRYNEDTDLSICILKDKACTIQYNAFLQGKMVTQAMKGGNTDEFYAKEGTLPKSQMIEDLHPDVCKVIWRFNRWHHYLDYSPFTHTLKLKNDIHHGNEYEMILKET